MPEFNKQIAAELDAVMRDIPEAKAGKMFGMPGYKVSGKLAVGVFEDTVVLKLGAERAQALIGEGEAGTFEPQPGRAWKDWISLTGDLTAKRALLEEAVRYVAQSG
jgi:hypothetical protein